MCLQHKLTYNHKQDHVCKYDKTEILTTTNSYLTGMGPAVLDTWIESVCHTLQCEISALEDFNAASVPCWPSQVARITGTPCTTWNTTPRWMWTTHTHTHTPGVPITVSVPLPLLTLPCRLLKVQEYCPASLVVATELNSRAVRGLTWYLAVLETSSGIPLYLHCTVGWGTVSRLGKQSKKASPYSKTVRLVGPLWMTGSSERQGQWQRMQCTTVMQTPNQHTYDYVGFILASL